MPRVAVAVGANLGDRQAHLNWAIGELRRLLANVVVSSVHETAAVDTPDPQPDYLNAVVAGTTSLEPEDLLNALLALEAARGRTRSGYHAARTLDLDLIFYGDAVLDRPDLIVPHPRFRERRFVLEPLAEVAGDWRDPITGRTAGELLGT